MWDIAVFELFVGRRSRDPDWLLKTTGKVTTVIASQEPWTLAWCIDFASWKCFWIWHIRRPEVYDQKSITQLNNPFAIMNSIIHKLTPRSEWSQIFRHHSNSEMCSDHPEEHSRSVSAVCSRAKTPKHWSIAGRWDHLECAIKYWLVIN
jgi:hypothetical protein